MYNPTVPPGCSLRSFYLSLRSVILNVITPITQHLPPRCRFPSFKQHLRYVAKEAVQNCLRLLPVPLGLAVAFALAIAYFWAAGHHSSLPRGFVGFSIGVLLPLFVGTLIARPGFNSRFWFRIYAGLLFVAGVPALLFCWLYIDTIWFNSPL